MTLPFVAIVGRPNVGKSRLFNRLVGKPVSIVDSYAGVTRDRILHPVERDDLRFDLVDTGGIGIVDADRLEGDVHRQVERAVATADRILFVVDGRAGIHPLDLEIAERLRPEGERVQLIVNKLDYEELDDEVHQYQKLGVGDPLGISAAQARGIEELYEHLAATLPKADDELSAAEDDGRLKLCLAGRRNVGKSSLTNALCGEERVIVAEYAGTTRDAVDVALDTPQGPFLLIDTAGLRKKKQLTEDLEFYAACRTERGISRADVVFLVLDATEEVGTVDKKLAHFCEAEGKPTILVVNKWDLAEAGGADRDQYQAWLRDRLPGLRFAPIIFTSALEATGLGGLLEQATELHAQADERVVTAELNRLIQAAVSRRRPRKVGSGPTKLYYATQAGVRPPTFIVFVNRADWIEPGYSRYLENYLRSHLAFRNVPLKIIFKARASRFHENYDERPVTVARTKAEKNANLILPRGANHRGKKSGGPGGSGGKGGGGKGGGNRGPGRAKRG